MKKFYYILFFIFVLFSVNAYSQEICTDQILFNTTCYMVAPSINCTTFNYTIYWNNGTINEQGNLTIWDTNLYYFNWSNNKPISTYLIELCDGTTREVVVSNSINSINTPLLLDINNTNNEILDDSTMIRGEINLIGIYIFNALLIISAFMLRNNAWGTGVGLMTSGVGVYLLVHASQISWWVHIIHISLGLYFSIIDLEEADYIKKY